MLSRDRFVLRYATLFALTASLSGCRSAAPPDDTALNSAVQRKLANDSAISAEPVQSSVQSGVATLQGNVSSEAARALAASDASQVSGIRSVVNQLTVRSVSSSSHTPAGSVARGPLTAPATRVQKPSAIVTQRYNPPPPPAQTSRGNIAEEPAPVERRSPLPSQTAPTGPQLQHHADVNPEPRPTTRPSSRNITIPAGTTLPVRITQTLDSATAQQGDAFSGSLASDVLLDGLVALPAGTIVNGRLDQVHEAGHFKGSALLTLSLVSLNRRGEHTPISTEPYTQQGNGRGKNTAEKVGGGAAVGAILGGIFGGGKGAAIGAAAGGGLGAGANGVTRGQQVQIPSETLIRFRLTNPIEVRASATPPAEGSPTVQNHPDL